MPAGKVAVVTGASRGIGAATAIRLSLEGFDVCVNYLQDEMAASEVAKTIVSNGRKAIAVQADVSNAQQVARLFSKVDADLGVISALVNNAGILLPQSRLVDTSADRINKIFAANVTSQFLCCKEAVLRMSTKQGGSGGVIVNVSSRAAKIGAANEYIDYAASKGAIDTLTIGLAGEVADEGIRVNGVRPGYIYTQMHAAGGEPDRVNRLKNNLPMKRGGHPEEVAAAIAWLISNESRYTTGSFIEVSGGR
ncbi:MAG: SDR family oxidoreductase [Acidiferrobacterales bacterium]|nr:SDR family oxidoreductase [Acidiferrobacterales bacterium]